ncbi:hypothetical protein [Kitasatospora sp. HPMI-4]|uniref:hypothetical protein n=1 Tax=Kitasatospora sp. HPMI-4 TaxID=3448443 RepID=UPI003F1A375B
MTTQHRRRPVLHCQLDDDDLEAVQRLAAPLSGNTKWSARPGAPAKSADAEQRADVTEGRRPQPPAADSVAP